MARLEIQFLAFDGFAVGMADRVAFERRPVADGAGSHIFCKLAS